MWRAAAKQKTAAPPGAGLFAPAVLESEAAEKDLQRHYS
jgi:hypothetical protein